VAGRRPMWMTSVVDDADHVVSDDNMTAGVTSGAGVYRAICGATVVPPSMSEPPCGRCSYCRAVLRAWCQQAPLGVRARLRGRHS
jgi:threonine dehydrogenase-like Zn-dependent dehydrogenase